MKIQIERWYSYDLSLDGPEYENSYWEEIEVNDKELIELINKGEHIKINCP